MKKNRLYILAFLMIFISIERINSQQVFSTSHGIIAIKTSVDSTEINLISNDLMVLLNYETADILFQIKLSDLKYDSQNINSLLPSGKLSFNGSLGIEYINTKSHPKQELDIEGTMDVKNNLLKIDGTGVIEHLYSGGTMACLLSLKFHILKRDVKKLFPNSKLNEEIHIEVVQTVLDQQQNQYMQ